MFIFAERKFEILPYLSTSHITHTNFIIYKSMVLFLKIGIAFINVIFLDLMDVSLHQFIAMSIWQFLMNE